MCKNFKEYGQCSSRLLFVKSYIIKSYNVLSKNHNKRTPSRKKKACVAKNDCLFYFKYIIHFLFYGKTKSEGSYHVEGTGKGLMDII